MGKSASSPCAVCASSYQSRIKKHLAAHARICQHLAAQRHLLARLDCKAAAAEKRLGVQAHIGLQPGYACLPAARHCESAPSTPCPRRTLHIRSPQKNGRCSPKVAGRQSRQCSRPPRPPMGGWCVNARPIARRRIALAPRLVAARRCSAGGLVGGLRSGGRRGGLTHHRGKRVDLQES